MRCTACRCTDQALYRRTWGGGGSRGSFLSSCHGWSRPQAPRSNGTHPNTVRAPNLHPQQRLRVENRLVQTIPCRHVRHAPGAATRPMGNIVDFVAVRINQCDGQIGTKAVQIVYEPARVLATTGIRPIPNHPLNATCTVQFASGHRVIIVQHYKSSKSDTTRSALSHWVYKSKRSRLRRIFRYARIVKSCTNGLIVNRSTWRLKSRIL